MGGSDEIDDSDKGFDQAMAGVKPLRREARVALGGRRGSDTLAQRQRRRAAVAEPREDSNPLTDTGIAPLDPWYILAFKRPGVQNGVYRKLKQGRYEAEARLDMHRMTVAEARRELYDFIREAYRLGLRSLLVVHGRGTSGGSGEARAVLKGCVNRWLVELDEVQAYHSAQPRHGGTGAAYVLLRKSPERKQENRVLFNKGRVPYDAS